MDDALRRLESLLDAEGRLYEDLRRVLQEEREVLFGMDPTRLEALARRKAELADEGRVLEHARVAVTRRIAEGFGLPGDHVRLETLCERAGDGHPGLRRAHNHLVILVSVVKELLDANRMLAGRSLSEVRATIDALGGLVREPTGYGAAPVSRETGRLVRRTA